MCRLAWTALLLLLVVDAAWAQRRMIDGEFELQIPVAQPRLGEQNAPALACNGKVYLAVWVDRYEGVSVRGTRIDLSGRVLDPSGFTFGATSIGGAQDAPAVAANGSEFIIVWSEASARPGQSNLIVARRFDPTQSPQMFKNVVLCSGPGTRGNPAVTPSGKGYFVAWQDERPGTVGSKIYVTVLAGDDQPLPVNGQPVSPSPGHQVRPAVTALSGTILTVWEETRTQPDADIWGALLHPNGARIQTEDVAISVAPEEQSFPALAANGGEFLVAWRDERQGLPHIFGTRVSSTGTVRDPSGLVLSQADGGQGSPCVAAKGDHFLAAWTDRRNSATSGLDIFGTRVGHDGRVIDSGGIALARQSAAQTVPAISSDGTNYLVAWADGRNAASTGGDIYGCMYSGPNPGIEVQELAISTSVNVQALPRVAASRSGYLALWVDTHGNPDAHFWVYGARLSQDGRLLDPSATRIGSQHESELFPSLASDGTNYLVAWSGWTSTEAPQAHAALIRETGVMIGPLPVTTNAASHLAVASNGQRYLVAWEDYGHVESHADIYGALLDSSGAVLISNIPICTAPKEQSRPVVCSNGTDFLVAWQDSRFAQNGGFGVFACRVTADGAVLDPAGLPLWPEPYTFRPSIASNGREYLVAWEGAFSPGAWGLAMARVQADGSFSSPGVLRSPALSSSRTSPRVLAFGRDYLALWIESRSGVGRIVGTRILEGGTGLDEPPLAFSTIDPEGPIITSDYTYNSPIDAAGNGNRLLVLACAPSPGNSVGVYRIFGNLVGLEFPPTIQEWRRSGSTMALSWLSSPYTRYHLEYTDSLSVLTWHSLPQVTAPAGFIASTFVPIELTAPHRFYRLQLDP